MNNKFQEEAVRSKRPALHNPQIVLPNLVIPGFLLLWSFVVIVPLLVIVTFSFFEVKTYQIIYEPTLATWESIISSGRWQSILRTVRIATTITLVEFALAFPFALWLAKGCKSNATRATVVALLTIPFFLDVSSRIIVWQALLSATGAVNTALMSIGLISSPVDWFLYSEFAVHLGLLGSYFPTMVFPVFMSIALIDDTFIEASKDLGAGPAKTLTTIIFPLAMPGIIAGIIFTMVPLMAAFVEPQMLGGGFVDLLGNSVQSAFQQLKYPTAAALTTVVVVSLTIGLVALVLVLRKRADVSQIFAATRH